MAEISCQGAPHENNSKIVWRVCRCWGGAAQEDRSSFWDQASLAASHLILGAAMAEWPHCHTSKALFIHSKSVAVQDTTPNATEEQCRYAKHRAKMAMSARRTWKGSPRWEDIVELCSRPCPCVRQGASHGQRSAESRQSALLLPFLQSGHAGSCWSLMLASR